MASILAVDAMLNLAELTDTETPEQVPDSLAPADLPLAKRRIYRQYQWATEQETRIKSDRDAYEFLAIHSEDEEPLPAFDTWSRYLRAARAHYGDLKNRPRSGRTGRNVRDQRDI